MEVLRVSSVGASAGGAPSGLSDAGFVGAEVPQRGRGPPVRVGFASVEFPNASVGDFTGVPGSGDMEMESPISASLGAMGSLLRKLDMLLLEPSVGLLRFHKGAKRWTHLLKDDLEEITSYLLDLSEVDDPPLTAKCWMKEVRELSYDIENYIDSFVLPGHVANIKTRSSRRRRLLLLRCRIRARHIKITRLLKTNKKLNQRKRVAARISDFRIEAREALERHKRYELHCCTGIRRVLLPAAGWLPATWKQGADIIIEERMRKFMDSMADDRDPQLKVVSVVGPEGIGKTTLVKVLYHKLKGQFDCRAFIRLTRKPDIKTVLRDILTQVHQQQQPHNHCEDPDPLGKIREYLQFKRYLIVIDDLWSASIWDVVNYAFPGGRMCSRIIISTQIEDVALACCCYHPEYVFRMTPLDGHLSRELFLSRLFFPERDFPQKLKEVLNKIVKICSGLPLATTIIASVLATHPVILMEQWTYIYDVLSSKLRTSSSPSEGMKLVVNFCYNNLTCHLKTCLLYLSIYPEGYTVCKDDLVKQWVAEGFIDGTEGREIETAESYFHELIGRRFLQPECVKYTGEVVSCSVHEVVRDLIAQKSAEENFVVVLDRYRSNVSLSEKVHRLSVHFPHTIYAMTNIRSQVRSLTCFGSFKCMPSIREFKLLRVLNLNLSGHDDDNDGIIDLTGISDLLRLRYLKVASDVCVELPKHMGGLRYLETLDICKNVTDIASDIIHLPCLLHLHLPLETNLMDWLDMTGPAASVWSLGKLSNLQYLFLTYSIPVPDHLQRNMEALGSLFRGHGILKTLAFILSSAHKNAVAHGPAEATVTWDWDDFAPPLERFEWLPHSCSFSGVPKWIGELGNLCILKISVRELMSNGVNILGELPALTTLSLYVKIAHVKRIIFDKAGFSVLKYFKFKCSTVPWLKFETDAMPNLQKLKLGFSAHSLWVDQQSTVPIIIEHLPGLKEISAKVRDASSDAESALMAVVRNHPRNPRIRMQLVGWDSYGHRIWYMVSKQENPDIENVMIGPDSDIVSSCISFLSGTTLHEMDQQSTVPISIEHLPGPKGISVKVRDACSDAESALTAAVSNHQRNPRIRTQLVDWNSKGHRIWYTVSKQENPDIENVMLGPDSDIVSSCSSFLPGTTLHENNWREILGIQTGDLRQLIIACGKAVDENANYIDVLLSELREMVSVSGEPMQRLGAYMLEGLIARLSFTGYALYKSLKGKEPVSSELLSYMHLLYEICPFFKFGCMSANGAIAEAVKGEDIIHIIDFQIAQGSQWTSMIQALASRPGRRPYLRITGIDDSNSSHARGGELDITGKRLHRVAQLCGLPFEFNAVPAASHEVAFEDLCVRPGEAIAVNFAYQLHHTPDESVGTENHRDRILRMVKSLSPKVVTLVEQEANTNTAPFFLRYMETLDYYTAIFEAIDVACPRDDKKRISTEQHCVARDIINLIACEGTERIERHEPFGKWRARLAMAGFRPYPLSPVVNKTIETLLDSYHSYYRLEERDGILYLGWKNRKLVVCSAWC